MTSRCRIEFVYFDLGNVLVSFDPEIACQNISRLFGVDVNEADRSVYQSGLQDEFEHGRVTPQQYAQAIRSDLAASGQQVTDAEILDAVSAMFTPIESMTGVVQSVRERGLPVGVLSNTCVAHWDWILRQNYDVMRGPFATKILSCDVQSMKPDPLIYQAAETAAQVAATKILFLDDKPENVAAARQRGWQSEVCVGGDSAANVLRQYGVIEADPAVDTDVAVD